MAKQKHKIAIKKILEAFALGVFAVIILAVILLHLPYMTVTENTMASSSDNINGWAWFSTIGWVSFNNTNLESAIPYGVDINATTGDFNNGSYAWSSNIGWIDFNPVGATPAVATGDDYAYQVKLDSSSRELRGWARIICMSGDGGWVRFHPDDNDNLANDWGVSLATGANKCTDDGKIRLVGYGWSDDFGWVKFNGMTQDGHEYGVYLDATPGIPSNISVVPSISSPCSAISVSWTYSGNGATGFEVQRKTTSSAWATVCSVGADSFGCVDTGLAIGEKYFYQVRTLGECNSSEWVASGQVSTSSVCAFSADSNGDFISVKGECPSSVIVSWDAPSTSSSAELTYSISRKEVKDENGNIVLGASWMPSSSGTCSASPIPPSCIDTTSGTESGKKTYIYKVIATDTNTGDYVEAESREVVPCPSAPSWIER